jgi:hypothetical protein
LRNPGYDVLNDEKLGDALANDFPSQGSNHRLSAGEL